MKTLGICFFTVASATVLVAPLFAQTAEFQATYRGGGNGDSGKCTIEVYVDGAAEVELRGGRGLLRTLSGRPAEWRRFDCSGPMPVNPGDLRFTGVDGRGRQDLVQDPRNGRGSTVVRIQDREGGAEGYTFDVEWRGTGAGSFPMDPQRGGYDRGATPNNATLACQDAVRARASQQYGFRNIDFRIMDVDNNPGRDDAINGAFEVRQGNNQDTYRFTCLLNLANGVIREVEIVRGRGPGMMEPNDGRNDVSFGCLRAAEQKILGSGYRNVRIDPMIPDNRRNGTFTGAARAQRGNNGRTVDFDVRCAVNLRSGNVRSVDVRRR